MIGGIVAAYYFGSFKLRSKIERITIRSIHVVRSPEFMPGPIVTVLNMAYDAIPESQGLVVEGGELAHEDTPLIAGVPQSDSPVRVLHNKSYINLFNERERQSSCIAFKISDRDRQKAKIPDDFFEDPRIKQLRASDMELGRWMPQPIAPPAALAKAFGEDGANEAHLVTNLAPMTATFTKGLWKRLLKELTVTYPKRFGEIWIYLGDSSTRGKGVGMATMNVLVQKARELELKELELEQTKKNQTKQLAANFAGGLVGSVATSLVS